MPHPFYFLSVGAGIALLIAFPATRNLRRSTERREYYRLQLITIIGAVIGAKLSVLFGDYGWPLREFSDWHALATSGRSITGALIGGFVAAELAKPLLKYTIPPNDRFAAILPFSIGIGRVGCLLTGCCLGIPYDGFGALRSADVPRFPVPIVEMIFHFTVGFLFLWCVKRDLFFGRLFAIYLVAYGAFRFATEPFRETPKFFHGFSGYQFLSLVMIIIGAVFVIARSGRVPESWNQFRNIQPDINPL